MILAIKTDSMVAEVYLFDNEANEIARDVWEAGRGLAKDLLLHIENMISSVGSWDELDGIIVFRGPGSFTGLRIGITTVNTVAYAKNLPVVGGNGEAWVVDGLARLSEGQNDKMVLPEYGADPHITAPKK